MKKIIINIIFFIVVLFMILAIPFFFVCCIFYHIAGFFSGFAMLNSDTLCDWQRKLILSLDKLLDDN